MCPRTSYGRCWTMCVSPGRQWERSSSGVAERRSFDRLSFVRRRFPNTPRPRPVRRVDNLRRDGALFRTDWGVPGGPILPRFIKRSRMCPSYGESVAYRMYNVHIICKHYMCVCMCDVIFILFISFFRQYDNPVTYLRRNHHPLWATNELARARLWSRTELAKQRKRAAATKKNAVRNIWFRPPASCCVYTCAARERETGRDEKSTRRRVGGERERRTGSLLAPGV